MKTTFTNIALGAAAWVGSPGAFVAACVLLLGWGATGPVFHFSNQWQLTIDTCTSIVIFLIVVLIQYSQNRDVTAIQLKLDELIRAVEGARTHLVPLEEMSDEELARLQVEFQRLQRVATGRRPDDKGRAPPPAGPR